MFCIIVVFSLDTDLTEVSSLIIIEFKIILIFDIVCQQAASFNISSQMTYQQSFVRSDKSFMILDQIFRQLNSDTFKKVIFTVNFSRILNNRDLLTTRIIVRKIDMMLGDSMPIQQSLCSISKVSLSNSFISQKRIMNE